MANTVQGPRIDVSFPGGKRVSASFLGYQVNSDQSVKSGGEGSAPSPFDLFFASLATCAGYYVLEFCTSREIPLDGVRLTQVFDRDLETKQISSVHLDITVPPDFPTKYHKAVMQAANGCTVKKLLENPPAMNVRVKVG